MRTPPASALLRQATGQLEPERVEATADRLAALPPSLPPSRRAALAAYKRSAARPMRAA